MKKVGSEENSTNGPWPGPQAYYKLSLVAGNKANIKLIPDSNFDAALYAFNANTVCYASSVNTACSSFVSDAKGPGLSETININTSIAAEYVIVVDSWSPSEVGTFTLEVSVGN